MAGVKIYQFRVYDITTDKALVSRRWGTREAIQNTACGEILEATEVLVDEGDVRSDITGLTDRDYKPVPYKLGFQTQAR